MDQSQGVDQAAEALLVLERVRAATGACANSRARALERVREAMLALLVEGAAERRMGRMGALKAATVALLALAGALGATVAVLLAGLMAGAGAWGRVRKGGECAWRGRVGEIGWNQSCRKEVVEQVDVFHPAQTHACALTMCSRQAHAHGTRGSAHLGVRAMVAVASVIAVVAVAIAMGVTVGLWNGADDARGAGGGSLMIRVVIVFGRGGGAGPGGGAAGVAARGQVLRKRCKGEREGATAGSGVRVSGSGGGGCMGCGADLGLLVDDWC